MSPMSHMPVSGDPGIGVRFPCGWQEGLDGHQFLGESGRAPRMFGVRDQPPWEHLLDGLCHLQPLPKQTSPAPCPEASLPPSGVLRLLVSGLLCG